MLFRKDSDSAPDRNISNNRLLRHAYWVLFHRMSGLTVTLSIKKTPSNICRRAKFHENEEAEQQQAQ